jgi:hypothetical protein
LSRDNQYKQVQLGTTKTRLELADIIEFENILQRRIQQLKLKLKESNELRESNILINEIDTLDSTLGRLADLMYGDKAHAIEKAEANNDFRRTTRLQKQVNAMYDLESEISTQIKTKVKSILV